MMHFRINADDFGLDHKTNLDIIRAWERGLIDSTSMLVCREGTNEAILLVGDTITKGFRVGLHLDFTNNYNIFFLDYITGWWSLEKIERCCRFQVERFLNTGIKLNHIDSHLGVHYFPAIFKIVSKIAKEIGVPVRNPIRRLNFNIFNLRQCIGDNMQWLFYQFNKKYGNSGYMYEPGGDCEIVCHPAEW